MPSKEIRFTVIVDHARHEKLIALATAKGISRGAVIRQSIDALYLMLVDRIPTCATGGICFVPHMHPSYQKQVPPPPNQQGVPSP